MFVRVTGAVAGVLDATSAPHAGDRSQKEVAAADDAEARENRRHRAKHAANGGNAVERSAQDKQNHADQEKRCAWDLEKFHGYKVSVGDRVRLSGTSECARVGP